MFVLVLLITVVTVVKSQLLGAGMNGCSQIMCQSGQICIMKQVNCIISPCNPVAVCVDPPPVCNLKCSIGYECVMVVDESCWTLPCPKVPRCQRFDPPQCPLPPLSANPYCEWTDLCFPIGFSGCNPGLACCTTDCGRRCISTSPQQSGGLPRNSFPLLYLFNHYFW